MADVATRVVAWHNRWPWARRIAPADVSGVGVVALPFALKAPPDAAALQPLFGHDWLYRAAHRQLGAWVRRHGRDTLPACVGWPLRQIDADLALSHRADAAGLEGRTLRHVLTAVVDSGGHRVRVLLAPPQGRRRSAVLGLRIWHPARSAGLGLALVLLLAAGTAARLTPPAAAPPAAAMAAAMPPPAPPPKAEPSYPRPPDVPISLVERRTDTAPLATIRPQIGPADRQRARTSAQALRQARAAAPAARMFAIVTPAVRRRDDAQAQQAALQGLRARTATPQPTQLELIATQGRWRVVWWPHAQRADAEDLLVQARARGLKVELIDF